jgi:hypothetical protein
VPLAPASSPVTHPAAAISKSAAVPKPATVGRPPFEIDASTALTKSYTLVERQELVREADAGSEGKAPTPRPRARSVHGEEERGVYPCPFGYAVNVPLQRSDRLVPVVAGDAAALAPLADALALVRASGGFEAHRMRVPTAEIRFVYDRVPDRARATRRLRSLARDLLALGRDALPSLDPSLDFQPALELRCPNAQALSVHLYVEGTSSLHETLLARFAERLDPVLRALIEASGRVETPFVLRRRVLARCHVELDHLFASLPERAPDGPRETRAVQQALHWLGAARSEPVLALAQNELVLSNVARVVRALDDDGQRATAEGHCHAARFGAAVPLASFAAAGPRLLGALELPLGVDFSQRAGPVAALASGLMRGESIEDIGVLSTCLGLAAQLASVKAAISLALSGVVPVRASVPPRAASAARERRSSTPPPLPVRAASAANDRRSTAAPSPTAAAARKSWPSLRQSPPDVETQSRPPAPPEGASAPPARSTAARLPPSPARRSSDDSGVRPAVHARRVPLPSRQARGKRR